MNTLEAQEARKTEGGWYRCIYMKGVLHLHGSDCATQGCRGIAGVSHDYNASIRGECRCNDCTSA